MKRDFLHITDFTTEEVWETLELARWIKNKFYKEQSEHRKRISPNFVWRWGAGAENGLKLLTRFTPNRNLF